MRFRELRIEASKAIGANGIMPPDFVFRWTAHHVREIFTALLPRNFDLDGSSVIQITCGPCTNDSKYESVLGSSEYFIEDFDFGFYAAASSNEREALLLSSVETALIEIAALAGTSPAAIMATAQAVRDGGFKLELEVIKLRKRLPSSTNTVRVFRCLSSMDGETWRARCFDKNGKLCGAKVMGKAPDFLDRRDFYHAAELRDGQYIVLSRLGKETFCFHDAPN